MYNPESHTRKEVRNLIKAMRQDFPTVKVAPKTYTQGGSDVCKGGALLIYSVRKGLVDPHALMCEVNVGHELDEPEEDWPIQAPDTEEVLDEEYRFPVPQILEVVLIGLNPRLADTPNVAKMASDIIEANDAGHFRKAEQLIESALCWPDA